jgi:hypothetical protein
MGGQPILPPFLSKRTTCQKNLEVKTQLNLKTLKNGNNLQKNILRKGLGHNDTQEMGNAKLNDKRKQAQRAADAVTFFTKCGDTQSLPNQGNVAKGSHAQNM